MGDRIAVIEKYTSMLRDTEKRLDEARKEVAVIERDRQNIDQSRRDEAIDARRENVSVNVLRTALGFASHTKTVNYLEGKPLRTSKPRGPRKSKLDDDLYF